MMDSNTALSQAKGSLDAVMEAFATRERQVREREEAALKHAAEAQKEAEAMKRRAAEEAEAVVEEARRQVEDVKREKRLWEAEKERVASTMAFEKNVLKLNVGGKSFATTRTTLTRFPESVLGAMFSGRHRLAETDDGAYFIDRDGTTFRHVLNYLRSPDAFHVDLVPEKDSRLFIQEFEYYGLHETGGGEKFVAAWWSAECKSQDAHTLRVLEAKRSGEVLVDDERAFLCKKCDRIVSADSKTYFDLYKNKDLFGRPWPSSIVREAYSTPSLEYCPGCRANSAYDHRQRTVKMYVFTEKQQTPLGVSPIAKKRGHDSSDDGDTSDSSDDGGGRGDRGDRGDGDDNS